MTKEQKNIYDIDYKDLSNTLERSIKTSINPDSPSYLAMRKLVSEHRIVSCRGVLFIYIDQNIHWTHVGNPVTCSVLSQVMGLRTSVAYETSVIPLLHHISGTKWPIIKPEISICFKEGRLTYTPGLFWTYICDKEYLYPTLPNKSFNLLPLHISYQRVYPADYRCHQSEPIITVLLRSLGHDGLVLFLQMIFDTLVCIEGHSRPKLCILMGPANSGKSFILDILQGIFGPTMGEIEPSTLWEPLSNKELASKCFNRCVRFGDTDLRRLSISSIKKYTGNDTLTTNNKMVIKNCLMVFGAINDHIRFKSMDVYMKHQIIKRVRVIKTNSVSRRHRINVLDYLNETNYEKILCYAIYQGIYREQSMGIVEVINTITLGSPESVHENIDFDSRIKGSYLHTETFAGMCNTTVDNVIDCVSELNPSMIAYDEEDRGYVKHIKMPPIRHTMGAFLHKLCQCQDELKVCTGVLHEYSVSSDTKTLVLKHKGYVAEYTKFMKTMQCSIARSMVDNAIKPYVMLSLVYDKTPAELIDIFGSLSDMRWTPADSNNLNVLVRNRITELGNYVDLPHVDSREVIALREIRDNPKLFGVELSQRCVDIITRHDEEMVKLKKMGSRDIMSRNVGWALVSNQHTNLRRSKMAYDNRMNKQERSRQMRAFKKSSITPGDDIDPIFNSDTDDDPFQNPMKPGKDSGTIEYTG